MNNADWKAAFEALGNSVKAPKMNYEIPKTFDYSILQNSAKNLLKINPPKYKDTIFKDLAEDIKESQDGIASQIYALAEETRKSNARSTAISVAAFIVASLTLIATVYFGLR